MALWCYSPALTFEKELTRYWNDHLTAWMALQFDLIWASTVLYLKETIGLMGLIWGGWNTGTSLFYSSLYSILSSSESLIWPKYSRCATWEYHSVCRSARFTGWLCANNNQLLNSRYVSSRKSCIRLLWMTACSGPPINLIDGYGEYGCHSSTVELTLFYVGASEISNEVLDSTSDPPQLWVYFPYWNLRYSLDI